MDKDEVTSQGNRCSSVHPGRFTTLSSVGCFPGGVTEQEPNSGVLNCPQEVPLPLPSPWRAYRVFLVNLTV